MFRSTNSFEDFLGYLNQSDTPGFTRENVGGVGEAGRRPYYEQYERNERLFSFLKDGLDRLVAAAYCGKPVLQGLLPEINYIMLSEYGWGQELSETEQDRPRQLAGHMIKFLLGEFGFMKEGVLAHKLDYSESSWPRVFENCSIYTIPKWKEE